MAGNDGSKTRRTKLSFSDGLSVVMAGLGPAIHVVLNRIAVKTWMPGIKPGMTLERR
jgi:hypothetical protein